MIVPDANILLYAANRDAPHHKLIRSWWEEAANGDEPLGLWWGVLLAFLRISTNPRIFDQPLSLGQVMRMVDAWLAHPNVRVLTESDQHWAVYRRLLVDVGTAGNLTTDAHLAALAITHGAVLVSCDADFARFRGLRWENPLLDSLSD